jgi:hypothetical protein
MYNDQVGIDTVILSVGDFSIDTTIPFITSAYIVFKLDTLILDYVVADHPGIITNNNGMVKITLPIINNEQNIIPEKGSWVVRLCNSREAQRQSLSKALRPKADL